MRNFTSLIVSVVFFLGTSLTSPIDKNLQDQLVRSETQIKVLSETIQSMSCEQQELKDSLVLVRQQSSDPHLIREAYADLLSYQTVIPGTRFAMRGGVDPRISPRMLLALVEYQGPSILVSSAKRHTNKRSQHFYGDAIDISKLSSKAFVSYLRSNKGMKWLEEHNLDYYIEDTKYSSFLESLSGPKVFVNPFATGPHIHLYLKHE